MRDGLIWGGSAGPGRGSVFQTLGKEGFSGECGDTKGKLRGDVTLPKATQGASKQGPLGLRCPTRERECAGTHMRSVGLLWVPGLDGMSSLCCCGEAGVVGGGLRAGLCAPRRPGSWELLKTPSGRDSFLSRMGVFYGVGRAGEIVSQGAGKAAHKVPAPVGTRAGPEPSRKGWMRGL